MENFLENVISNGNKNEILQLLQQPNIDIKTVNEVGDTVLHLILRNDKLRQNEIIEMLDILINRNVDPNVKNKRQETLLHLALIKWDIDIVEYLLKKNAKMDIVDDQGHSIVYFFVRNMLERFVAYPPNSDEEMMSLEQSHSIERESAEFVEWLLMKGFAFDVKNKKGKSALQFVIECNLQHILPVLLKHTRDINFISEDHNRTLLHLFVQANIAGKYANVDDNRKRLKNQGYEYTLPIRVHFAAFSRRYDIEIVKIFFERGVSFDYVDRHGFTVIGLAIQEGETMDIIALLFDCFAKYGNQCKLSVVCTVLKNVMLRMQLHSEFYDYYYDMFKILSAPLDQNMAVDNKCDEYDEPAIAYNYSIRHENDLICTTMSSCSHNLFHALAEKKPNDQDEVVYQENTFDFLIAKGCDVNARTCEGRTPLHLAASSGNIIIVRKLVACGGVEVNCRDYVKDWTPLHLASAAAAATATAADADKQELAEIVKLLVDNGAQVNSKSRWTAGRPIHLAANCKSNDKTLKMLLECGAEVNARDLDGNSALSKAILIDCLANIEELLAYGADVDDISVIQSLRQICNSSCSAAKTFVMHHLMKLKAAKLLSCSKECESFDGQISAEFHETYLKEVDKLKSTYIDSQTSLYQWLHTNPYRRFLHIRHEKLPSLIADDSPATLVGEFPQYSTVILGYHRETEVRKAMFYSAKRVWYELTEIDLPDDCLEHIFVYLNTGFLFDFIEQVDFH